MTMIIKNYNLKTNDTVDVCLAAQNNKDDNNNSVLGGR